MTYQEKLDHVRSIIGGAPIYEQLAEECAELAQASLKMSRFIREENPPAKDFMEIVENVMEEISDVSLLIDATGMYAENERKNFKLDRWINRLENR